MKFQLPPIYPITDKSLAQRTDHLSILKELVRGGAGMVQIRDKLTPARELLPDLRRCSEFASKNNVLLVLNDRCDFVLSSGASGVHLGMDDLPPDAARSVLGQNRIIGFSTHSLRQARTAAQFPIHYIGFGPVFETSTKKDTSPAVGLQKLKQVCSESALPVVAVGGIGRLQIRQALDAGASSVAIISALMTSSDIARQMHFFLETARGK